MTERLTGAPAARIGSLDLIRGIAVLGILAINIGGFAGPGVETISPNYLGRVSPVDEWTFATTFLLFEGKMRALFTLLFGASVVLQFRLVWMCVGKQTLLAAAMTAIYVLPPMIVGQELQRILGTLPA